MKGETLVARAILEIGKDDAGSPALLVERLYAKPGVTLNQKRMIESLLAYGEKLGVKHVYFADTWDVSGAKRSFELLNDLGLRLSRDTYKNSRVVTAIDIK